MARSESCKLYYNHRLGAGQCVTAIAFARRGTYPMNDFVIHTLLQHVTLYV
jgi:hypothetical protein